MIPDELKELIKLDELQKGSYDHQVDCYLHRDHRWNLPVIFYYQQIGILPKPCKLLMFDMHDDGCDVSQKTLDKIKNEFNNLKVFEIIEICKSYLNPQDDDWVKAGIELGIFSNIIAFGVHEKFNKSHYDYVDFRGNSHSLNCLGLPIDELGGRGHLDDLCKRDAMVEVWEDLNWAFIPQTGFEFRKSDEKLLIDIDLDCFSIHWNDYTFPWLKEVYNDKFLKKSCYWEKRPWTGQSFFHGLLDQAGLITIAKEPSFCGGEIKAKRILHDINRYLFGSKLEFQ